MNAKRSCHFLKYAHKYARMMKNQENMVLTNKGTEFFNPQYIFEISKNFIIIFSKNLNQTISEHG